MEHLLKLVGERSPQYQQEVSIDSEKLTFFTSKVKIWEYARLNYENYQKLSVEDRSSVLKSYYVDMFTWFSNSSGTWFCFLLFVFCLSDCFTSFTYRFVVTRACCYEHSTGFFFLCIAMKFLICLLGKSSSELDVLSGMKSANLVIYDEVCNRE